MPLITQRGLTLVGVTVTNLDETSTTRQLALPMLEECADDRD
jgi:hypothetical protein